MGLLDTILGGQGTKPEAELGTRQPGGPTGGIPGGMTGILLGIVGEVINQHGGLQGLMGTFGKKGLGEEFSSWVGTGENKPINEDQVQRVLGNEHVAALATRFGIDPAKASELISQYLPKIVDKLTPEGKINPNHDVQSRLDSLAQGGAGGEAGDPGKPGGETE